MSVWKAACYRDDALQAVASSLSVEDLDCPFVYSLCAFDVEDHGDHPLPAGIHRGPLRDQLQGRPERVNALLERRPARGGYPRAFAALLRSLPEARFGVHGVYKFVRENWDAFTGPRPDANLNPAFFDSLFAYGYAASLRTGAEAVDKSKTIRKSLQEYVEGPYQAIRDLISVGVRCAGRKYRSDCRYADAADEDYPKLEDKLPSWLNRYDVYWYRSVLILVSPTADCTYVLTRDDINRIERFALGLAWSGYYLAEYSDRDLDLRAKLKAAFGEIREVVKDSLTRVDKSGANSLCRSYDVVL